MPFRIVQHREHEIIEVVYPREPTKDDVEKYAAEITAIIKKRTSDWCCLVDQRELAVMAPELFEQIAALNSFARGRGMVRAARLVASAVAGLQAQRLAREAGARTDVRVFTSREEAIAWLSSRGG